MTDIDKQSDLCILIYDNLFPSRRANALGWGYETFAPRLTCLRASDGVIFFMACRLCQSLPPD